LLGKLVAAQMALEKAIGELIRSGASTTAADAQLTHLATLQTSIGTANAATLAAMSGEVAAAVAQSKAVTDQAREQATTASAGSALALADAARASRSAVNEAMDAARHFQLNFASPADEADYRKREDERSRYIAIQQAKHTPVGDLNASGGAIGQLVDAKAHGAHGSEFDKQWSTLVATTEKLREQVRASGGSTKEFDDHLRVDLRQIMKSKGLSDSQIDAQFAAHPDPLEAAKAYVANEDVSAITAKVDKSKALLTSTADDVKAAPQPVPPSTVDDAMAALKSAGVVASALEAGAAPAHGVTAQIASTSNTLRLG
jgi:hypothetical protein